MEIKRVKYIGPSGLNPELGYCATGEDKDIPVNLIEKYEELGYIEKEQPVKLKRSTSSKKEEE